MPRIFAIDPGLDGTGWAFSGGDIPVGGNIFDHDDKKPWSIRAMHIADVLGMQIDTHTPEIVVCENMQYEDSERGNIAAKKGGILKTEFLVGIIAGICLERGIKFELAEIPQWKGCVSKELMVQRICRDLGVGANYYKTHTWDAVGILLYARRRFEKT